LENEKVIRGYFADIDPEKIGFTLTAIINLRITKGKIMDLQATIAEHPRVFGVYDVTGEWDSLVLARFRDREEMDSFIKTALSQKNIERTSTSLVLNTVKEERRVLL
jgi:DNA-binding Lrp family transcriptional regulator